MAWQAQQQAEQQRAQLGGQRAAFERDSPNVRFGQAMRGNFAANAQDVTLDVPDRVKGSLVTYGGGLRPSAFGEGGRAAGRQLAEIGSSRMGQDTFELPTVSQAPRPAGLPKDNALDKLLAIAGPAAAFGGALGNRGPQGGGGLVQGGVSPELLRAAVAPQGPLLGQPEDDPFAENIRQRVRFE